MTKFPNPLCSLTPTLNSREAICVQTQWALIPLYYNNITLHNTSFSIYMKTILEQFYIYQYSGHIDMSSELDYFFKPYSNY